MASHLSTGTSRRNSPAYCKKGQYGGIVPTVHGLPKTLNAYAYFRWHGTGLDITLNELVHLRRNASDTGWEGTTKDGTSHLDVTVIDTPNPTKFGLALDLYAGDVLIDTAGWIHIQPANVERWDTGTKLTIHVPDYHEAGLRVMG